MGFVEKLGQIAHSWNIFNSKDTTVPDWSVGHITSSGSYFSYAPWRTRLSSVNAKTVIAPILNRIALDCSAVGIRHVKVDPENPDGYLGDCTTKLNRCLTLESNRDQSAADFWNDVFLTLVDQGEVAIVPTHTSVKIGDSNAWDVEEMRVGSVIQWRPKDVLVYVYDEDMGQKREVWMPKSSVAIIQNPFYPVMNESCSVLSRLTRKLAILDQVDEQSGSGKLDMIIQLPYAIKNEARRAEADKRREMLEAQLSNNKLGIGYIDSTEKVTQLNRSIENNLLEQVQYLTSLLYSQLGMTEEILNSTATEEVMLNYLNRTIAPIVNAVTLEMTRKFITKTAYTQGQRIKYFSDPFKLVSMTALSDIADKLTRNEIASTNEIRTKFLGWRPVKSQQADELRNKNLNVAEGQTYALATGEGGDVMEKGYTDGNGMPIDPNTMSINGSVPTGSASQTAQGAPQTVNTFEDAIMLLVGDEPQNEEEMSPNERLEDLRRNRTPL